ncbi:DNA-binding NarL/FixJ family response regulator [Cupriavidus metallidurans]|jgi:DNA-binding NarL/FixJ family response regulator|uniref:Transcriptional regulator, LuxR family n=1 Tax=Cupriavidus metallidurans (strain ATCC 43123 / DSM 2839 / NBRC 102507 / CH34) TaxID=266264 RepID=Q1LAY6_CUPMC|nr:response regulator transcription factor [Cupriavidus metallidurans]ABF12690.1 transcriptional regulator, LuxR family [Cupriavidus metallidurans CH34]AVA35350.1 DNA-binding response regulator [Cupriavidus metallidurans]KWW33131.1 Transcriptional regulatory protein DegU [Cupriavidus metallidurans]MDE4921041.1 response regulator transcription factor [Cupriavidus metallidurans]QGS32123.1 DNA-binding response regulator [Cupriavidus metallidurans]
MATILLFEPHPLLRLGLHHLLSQAHVPGDLVDLDPTTLHAPEPWVHHADLLIIGMPADSGAGWPILAELCLRLQPLRVLVLADHLPAPMPEGGLPEKVRGLLAKTCSSEALEAAIRLVLAGGECFPSHAPANRVHEPLADAVPAELSRLVATPVVVPLHGADAAAPAHADTHAVPTETPAVGAHLLNITERQYEVLALLARGYPIKTVSRLLNISVATAKTHACTLYQRLHVRNKGEAVYVALQRGASLNWPGPTPARPTHIPMSSLSAQHACEAA